MTASRGVAWLALFAFSACGGNSVEKTRGESTAGSAAAGGGGATAGLGGASGGGGGTAGDAVSMAGAAGRPIPQRFCHQSELSCIDGDRCACRDDPRPECQSTRTCEGDAWRLESGACPEPPPAVACPETPAGSHDLPCSDVGMVCDYPGELSCVCLVPYDLDAHPCRVVGNSGPVVKLWYCRGTGAACPDGIPAIGSACSVEEQHCGEPCANEYARVCRGGSWERWLPTTECV